MHSARQRTPHLQQINEHCDGAHPHDSLAVGVVAVGQVPKRCRASRRRGRHANLQTFRPEQGSCAALQAPYTQVPHPQVQLIVDYMVDYMNQCRQVLMSPI